MVLWIWVSTKRWIKSSNSNTSMWYQKYCQILNVYRFVPIGNCLFFLLWYHSSLLPTNNISKIEVIYLSWNTFNRAMLKCCFIVSVKIQFKFDDDVIVLLFIWSFCTPLLSLLMPGRLYKTTTYYPKINTEMGDKRTFHVPTVCSTFLVVPSLQ